MQEFLTLLSSKEVSSFVRFANEERYFHWDELRFHQPLPNKLDPVLAWAALAINRTQIKVELPLTFNRKKQISCVPSACCQEQLRYIDLEAGGNLGMTATAFPRKQGKYLYNSLMEEAIASSQLEGASTTLEVAKDMLRTERKPQTVAEQMIFNNYQAMLEIRKFKSAQLTPKLICHLQSILTHDTMNERQHGIGMFRKEADTVHVVDNRTQEVLHTPPAYDQIQKLVEELCRFANTESKPWIHPIIKGAVLHFMLGYIHPFIDGNGRTARALFYWFMLKNQYWLFEYLPISRIIIKAPIKYSRAYLYSETDSGDVTYFVRYNVKCLAQAVKEFHEYLRQEVSAAKEAEGLLDSHPELNHRQRLILAEYVKGSKDYLTIAGHQNKNNISQPTALKDLNQLAERGWLTKVKDGRVWHFVPTENLRNNIVSDMARGPKPQGLKKEKSNLQEDTAANQSEKLQQPSLFDLLNRAENK